GRQRLLRKTGKFPAAFLKRDDAFSGLASAVPSQLQVSYSEMREGQISIPLRWQMEWACLHLLGASRWLPRIRILQCSQAECPQRLAGFAEFTLVNGEKHPPRAIGHGNFFRNGRMGEKIRSHL